VFGKTIRRTSARLIRLTKSVIASYRGSKFLPHSVSSSDRVTLCNRQLFIDFSAKSTARSVTMFREFHALGLDLDRSARVAHHPCASRNRSFYRYECEHDRRLCLSLRY